MVLIFAGFSIKRTMDWKNKETLFRADIIHLKNSALANRMMANFLSGRLASENLNEEEKNKMIDEALQYYERSLKICPGYADVNYDLGKFYVAIVNDPVRALEYFKKVEAANDPYFTDLPEVMAKCYQVK